MEAEKDSEIKEIGSILLDIGTHLMSCGASSNRVRITVDRIAGAYGYSADMLITNRAIMITVNDEHHKEYFSRVKRTSPHGVNFRIVSGISRMSWHIVDEKWTYKQITDELHRLTTLPHYPRIVILLLVALAGASFCRLFGGDLLEMATTFVATFTGLFVRQEAHKLNFNLYLCVLFASVTASLISGFAYKMGWSDTMEHAFASSVLFLIPGVPLINTFTDIIDGNILNGMVRGINALVIIFMVALGLLSAMLIFGI
jgi:uncharacterized membrane protein YjjP (DUF1212 family)